MNLIDIVLLAILAVAVFFALRRIVLDRRAGRSCGGNCAGCQLDCKKRSAHANKEDAT